MGGGGWLEKEGIRLSQLSTKLKLKLKLRLSLTKLKKLFKICGDFVKICLDLFDFV